VEYYYEDELLMQIHTILSLRSLTESQKVKCIKMIMKEEKE